MAAPIWRLSLPCFWPCWSPVTEGKNHIQQWGKWGTEEKVTSP